MDNREMMDKEKFLVWLELAKKNQSYETQQLIEKIERAVNQGDFDAS